MRVIAILKLTRAARVWVGRCVTRDSVFPTRGLARELQVAVTHEARALAQACHA